MDVSRLLIQTRLNEINDELAQIRREISMMEDEVQTSTDNAQDARFRSLLSETPLASRTNDQSSNHAVAANNSLSDLAAFIDKLEQEQRALLERLSNRT